MRVVGTEGINKGVVYDIQDVDDRMANAENLGGNFDDYVEQDPADDAGKSAVNVANAAVRGDYAMNPNVDKVEAAKLAALGDEESVRAVVHSNKAPAAAKAKASAKKE